MTKNIFAAVALIAAFGCSPDSGNPGAEAVQGLEYCAGQTVRTLAQVSPAGYSMSPRNIAPGDSV